MRLCKFSFTITSSLPCLHTFWHAIPTSFYIFNVFKSCILYICRMSFCKCKLTFFNPNSSAGRILKRTLKRTLGQSITLPYSSLEPYFCQPKLLGKFCYPWIPHTSSRRALKLVQEQKSLKIGDGPETREAVKG